MPQRDPTSGALKTRPQIFGRVAPLPVPCHTEPRTRHCVSPSDLPGRVALFVGLLAGRPSRRPMRRSDRGVVQSRRRLFPEPKQSFRMPRLALKPDSSFFRKIALGAVGTRRVAEDLDGLGHRIVELERGAMDTKLWKEVKRKRVRIPDLVCEHCGLRVESRAKTNAELAMSHSPVDQERAWDFGMVDADVIAFPICKPSEERQWSAGRLSEPRSYWHERNWIRWQPKGKVNYVRVSRFRAVPHGSAATKGVTEGSETSVAWKARFSSRDGVVEAVECSTTITFAGRRGGDRPVAGGAREACDTARFPSWRTGWSRTHRYDGCVRSGWQERRWRRPRRQPG